MRGRGLGNTILVGSAVAALVATVLVVVVYPIFHPPGEAQAPAIAGLVSRDEIGLYGWPFTVTTGVLDCTDGQAISFLANGVIYGLNKPALDLGLPRPTRIIRRTSNGARMPLTEIIQRGISLC